MKEWILYKLYLWGWKKSENITPDHFPAYEGIDNLAYKCDINLMKMRKWLLKHPEIKAKVSLKADAEMQAMGSFSKIPTKNPVGSIE